MDLGLTSEHHTGPKQGVMFWGAISVDSRTPLVVIPGTLTAQRESNERFMKALGDKAPSIRTVFNCFNEFKFRNTNLEDEPRSDRPPTAVSQEKF
ncbi:hypothetical protein LAZ67_6003030 [Cordylochernes scorpioides]|uniref:Uncharacterized protein n=1 Tax=Cordylochernes scorpioides TaxID=51811 RepID=A0ABY6KK85_9ARAC|nr:hypothetical protein LAZ67_6003030 [Cordylochernes scorpioides]